MKLRLTVTCAALAVASAAGAADTDGRTAFERHCVHCHADSREAPGTLMLEQRRGRDSAVLTDRDDLVDAYIRTVVRNGLNAMPSFTPSDLDAATLDALVAFLAAD